MAQLVQIDPERVIRARETLAMTQQDLAEAAGVGRVTISTLERGLSSPRMPTLRKIAKALKVRPSDLLVEASA